jgi:tetratricopeptide (TPR) repeat protein
MKVFVGIITSAVVLLLASVGFCYYKATAMEIHTVALQYAIQGKFEEARHGFTTALEFDPSFGPARTGLALIDDVRGLKIGKELAVHHFKADGYIIKGDWDAAISECNKAVRMNPMFAVAYIDRGFVHIGKRDYDLAIRDFDKAIEIEPLHSEFYIDRGIVYSYKGDYDRAINDFDRAIRLSPKQGIGYYSRGLAYQGKGDFDRAICDFDKATALNPKEAMGYYSRGMAYQGKGDYDLAINDFSKAIALNPKETMGYYSRGMAYRSKGDFDRAISDFNKVIDLKPKEATGYYSRGMAYQGKGDFDAAIADFSKAINLCPKESKFYNSRGTAWQRKGDYRRAVADYAKALNAETDGKEKAVAKADTRSTLDKKQDITSVEGVNATPVKEEKRVPRPETIKIRMGNIRSKPTTNSSVIAKLGMGTEVTILHQEGEWCAVKFSGDRLGWAHEMLFGKSE